MRVGKVVRRSRFIKRKKKGKSRITIPPLKPGFLTAWPDNSRYTWANLPAIRRENGVGRPPAVTLARRAS